MVKISDPDFDDIATRAHATPNSLACALVTTAEWRMRCVEEYPDDNRNAVAVASLLKLADEFLLLSSSEALVKIYYETFETADDVSELVGIEQIILRDIEFGSQYDNIEELLSRLIDEFRVSLWPADPEPHQIVYH